MKILFICLVSILFCNSISEPDFIQKKGKNIELVYTNEIPKIDGILDKNIWDKAKISSDFLQEDPHNLSLPSNETRVRVLYDRENLYVFADLFIDDPNEISAKLVNRDNWEDGFDGFSDYFSFDIDSRHDHQTGFIFSVNAAGVQADAVVFDDSGYDPEWNAVWESNVAVFNDRWTVEMKIPFSILRFSKSDNMKWGLNMYRYIHSKNEYIAWVAYPYDIPGISSKYGHLSGFDKALSTKRFEFLPHIINGRTVYYDVNLEQPEKLPLNHKEILDLDVRTNYGFDIKYGLGSNASLDLTYNPDYGQIEADPSEINLTYYQTRFIDKRPFFLENSSIFDTPIEVFYTRRIGGNFEKINNAEKITGKTINNLTYGFIHASTYKDTSINNQPVKFKNNYIISRLTKDLLKGNSYIGMMTSHLLGSSNVVSFDGVFNLLENRISTNGQLVLSENEKLGKGFFYEFKYIAPKLISLWFEIDYYDKNFDINEVGYLRRNNFFNRSFGSNLFIEHPFHFINNIKLSSIYKYNSTLDYHDQIKSNLVLDRRIELDFSITFENYYQIGLGVNKAFERYDDVATYDYELKKIGPILKLPKSSGLNFNIFSDNTKPFIFNILYGYGKDDLNGKGQNYSFAIDYKISSNLNFYASKYYGESSEIYRWVEITEEQLNEFENRNHYIFSNSNNYISSTIFRINGNVSQTLGFQLYTEFFTNRNDLSNYSELLVNYSLPVDTTQYILNNPYVSIVDPNVGLADDELLDPNYYLGLFTKFSEFNTNFVITWNYNPGSNIYLVYSLNKNVNGRVFDNYIDFLRYNDPGEWEEILFDQSIYVKIDYWFDI